MSASFGLAEPLVRLESTACLAFPGARADGATATCHDPDASDGFMVGPSDVAVFVLDRRVDFENLSPVFAAVPTGVALEDPLGGSGTPDVNLWVGTPVRVVGIIDRSGMGNRVFVDAAVTSVDARTLTTSVGFDHGDSGGPTYSGDPDLGPPRVLGVHSRGGGVDARLSEPAVAAWLAPLLTGMSGPVYLGPVDVPPRGLPGRLPEHDAMDPDGDGLIGAHDNCPDLFNPAQVDTNGDGIGAECDADEDGVRDVVDNCPDTPNPLQENCDGDLVGDACELDQDSDGLPDDCDNCPLTYNPDQATCNEDTPQLHPLNGLARGVACLPTPCAEVDPIVEETGGSRGLPSFISSDLIEGRGLVTRQAGRHVDLGGGCTATEIEQTFEGTGAVVTGFRWCPCPGRENTNDARIACEARFGCLREAAQYSAAESNWNPMTVEFSRPRGFGAPLVGDEATTNYGAALPTRITRLPDPGATCAAGQLSESTAVLSLDVSLRGRWRFEVDAAAAGVPLPSRVTPFGTEVHLDAVGWAHSLRYTRCGTPPCAGSGLGTVESTPTGAPDDSLGAHSNQASHYWSGETDRRTFTSGREPDIIPHFPGVIPFPDICWFCAHSFPEFWLAHPSCPPGGCPAEWVARGVATDVPSNDLLTLGAHVALTQLGLRWVSAREVKDQLRPNAILLAGVDAQNEVIAQLAITDAGTLGLVEEKGDPLPPPPNPGPIEVPDVPFPQLSSAGLMMDAPCAHSGALLLMGNAHVLVGLGGGDPHIAFTNLDTGSLTTIPIRGPQPEHVRAAAMHVSRMEALLLDSFDDPSRLGHPHFLRFLVVDLRSGETRELARFPEIGVFDHHFLVGMADGRYALVASSERTDHVLVFAVAPDGEDLTVSGLLRLRGRAVGAPVASHRGISFPFHARREPKWAPIGVRPEDLRSCPFSVLRGVL